MTAFHTIAVPHQDIQAGRLTMEVFAADLWEVHQGRAPDEYRDAKHFFDKTYVTEGLQNLLEVVRGRLEGRGGDPVIQIQTPFGGGKTHALIAMYHKAREWGAVPVVLVGTAMSAEDTLWEQMARQLGERPAEFGQRTAPGKEALRAALAPHQPVLILMDEVLEYATKAAGVRVGDSTLAAQTVAFLQELTEVAGTLERVCVVMTLPASMLEHYDETAERLFQQVQKVAGRVEKIYTPVQEHEISQVIRRRLFARIDEKKAEKVVKEFLDYAVPENLLPAGVEPSEYRDRFLRAYPFLPEVIDVLYQRWGSFHTFQRTRGVLRLLALVVHSLSQQGVPYITLADFNLANQEIRRELLKHVGPEYDSVIAADITAEEAGARRVDRELGDAYQGLRLGTRTATTIFLYSFSGGTEKGASLGEIKRHATTLNNPSSVIAEALEMLKSKLFYIQETSGRVYFTNQPNLNRIILTREENITTEEILDEERKWLQKLLQGHRFKTYIWPAQDNDIPDTPELKLLILRDGNSEKMRRFLEQKGQMPRVHRNTLFFLVPVEHERLALQGSLRKYLALQRINQDLSVALNREQRDEISQRIRQLEKDLPDAIRRAYRHIYTPAEGGSPRFFDLGTPTYGESRRLDEEVYQFLRNQGEVLERLQPIVLRERYLRERRYLATRDLVESWTRTPGALRLPNADAWRESIREGVKQGLFGLGTVDENETLHLTAFREAPMNVALAGNEVLISANVSEELKRVLVSPEPPAGTGSSSSSAPGPEPGKGGTETGTIIEVKGPPSEHITHVRLAFPVPKGKIYDLMMMLKALQNYFEETRLEIRAERGSIPRDKYDQSVGETFRQLGIQAEEDLHMAGDNT